MTKRPHHLSPTTELLHADRFGDVAHGAVMEPTHNAVAYGYASAQELVAVFKGERSGYVYGRQGNPTTTALEHKVTLLEDGVGTLCFSTGMAAISAVMLSLLRQGDHVVASRFLFGNTNSFLQTLGHLGCTVSLVDATVCDEINQAIRPETRIVFVETIANPRTQIADLHAIGQLCHERGLLYVVDNTMTSPYLFRPATVQAGLVVNSLTKSIGGHGHALGGAVTDTGLFDWAGYPHILPLYQKGPAQRWGLLQMRKKGLRDMGATLSGDSAHRIAVGAETLGLRLDKACANALAMAEWLEQHELVHKVHYPGLPSHPQHDKAQTWFRHFGVMLSFELSAELDCFVFLNALDIIIKSSHLGDNRTLALPVAHTIFWEMGPQRRLEMGISDSLIRVSVGIEDFADLQADLMRAFYQAGLVGVDSPSTTVG
jgi:O-acetylhomoserine (thiol)-lyase